MKRILSFSALCAVLLTVSCQKNSFEEPSVTPESRTFTCVIASDATKVAVTDEGKSTWEVGDEILVHGEGSSNRKVVTLTAEDISADGKVATITVDGITPYDRSDKGYTSTYYACYPAGVVPSGNLYYYARFNDTNKLLMAAYNEGDTFVFYNLCGLISFTVSGEFDNYVFSGNNEETVGYSLYQARLAATDGDPVLQYNYPSDGGTSGPLTSISGPVEPDGKTVHYIALPNGADLTAGFTIKFKDGVDVVKVATTKTPVDVARNRILALGDITDRLKDYVPPTSSDHKSEIPTDGAIDLSANGSANSYLVTAPGIYKFPALQGNSSSAAGNVFGVELVWETWNNAETVTPNSVIAAVDFEDEWLYIQTPETLHPGNALIAAKNSEGEIIWSWHIWIPQTTVTTASYGNLFGFDAMDRNLGALVAATADAPADVLSFGLTYQWGRKDPFPGAGAVNSSSQAKVAGTAPTAAAGQITLAESIAHPTSLGHVDNGDWLSSPNNELWKNDEKTIYDPCPPGYRVPPRDKAQVFWSSDLTGETGWTSSADNYLFTVGNPAAVFPYTGYRDDYSVGGFSHAFDRTQIWSSYASSDAVAYGLDARQDKGTAYLKETPKARGSVVRCVSETAAEREAFENAEGMPVLGSYDRILVGDAEELSGLCLNKDQTALLGVSDQGALYEISFTGTVSTIWTHDADMEGITMDPATDNLYVAVEGEQKIYQIDAPSYQTYKTLFYVQEAVDGSFGNSGLEGIAYYKDNQIYVGAQYGANLWKYNLDGTQIAKYRLTTLAPGIEEVGGLFYDSTTDWLWVSDSEAHKLFVFKGDVSELLAIYDVSYISNAESVCVDHTNKCVWVGSDDSTSKLFKIAMS